MVLQADYFLSFELLQLYGAKYIETVAYNLDFPIDVGKAVEHLTEDTNAKYIQEHKGVTDTDRLVALSIKESSENAVELSLIKNPSLTNHTVSPSSNEPKISFLKLFKCMNSIHWAH